MEGTRHTGGHGGTTDPKTPYEPESDVGEPVAWCDTCGDERRFVSVHDDDLPARQELEADVPDVERALTGEDAWKCTVCGTRVPNLVSEEGYDYQWSNVGYTKTQFADEDDTIREARSEGVTPPARAEARYRPEDNE